MKNQKSAKLLKLTKETPEERKARVSSGTAFRAVKFQDRRPKLREKALNQE